MMDIDELMKEIEKTAINYFDFITTHDTENVDGARQKADELAAAGSIARAALRAEYDRMRQENTMLRGAMAADDERLRVEGERAGVEHCGCDTAHWMADEILGLRKELDAMVKDRDSENRWANQYHHDMLDVKVELAALKERSGTCTWTASDDDEYWHTDCGEDFTLEDGSPKDNGMRYCNFCGKQLVERINENETYTKPLDVGENSLP